MEFKELLTTDPELWALLTVGGLFGVIIVGFGAMIIRDISYSAKQRKANARTLQSWRQDQADKNG